MNRNLYNEKTDEAWNKVYAKLERNGLIEQQHQHHAVGAFMKWGIACAAVLLCIIISAVYITNMRTPQMLTQRNDEASSTLVKTLEDGSVVYLAGNSSLQYPVHFQENKRNVILHGNALFDVAKNKARPFFIDTKYTTIEVVGTSFNIKSNDKVSFELSVSRGKVKVTDKNGGKKVLVSVGETVTLSPHGLILRQTKAAQTGQYNNCIRFKDETLANIIRVINMASTGIKLRTVPEQESRRLTVSFSNDTPDMEAVLISEALNLRYTMNGNVITIR